MHAKPDTRKTRPNRKIRAGKLTLLLTILFTGGLLIAGLVYNITVNPQGGAHGPQSAVQPSTSATSAPAPVHASVPPVRTAPSPGCTTPSKPAPPAAHPVKPAKPAVVHYTVRQGDNLSVIAQRYHLSSYVPLYHANRSAVGNNPNLIYAGQVLKIPHP